MNDISPDIIKQAAAGHLPSFEQIFRAYSPTVYSVAFRMVRNHEDAEEVTQSVFLTLFESLQVFRFDSSLKTWIHRITVNAAINWIKKQARERQKVKRYAAEAPRTAPSNVESGLEREQKIVQAQEMLECLPIDQQVCLVLRTFEGMKYHEIAEILELNLNTVKARLKRARETLLARARELSDDEL